MPVKSDLDAEAAFVDHYLGEGYLQNRRSNLEEIQDLYSSVKVGYENAIESKDDDKEQVVPEVPQKEAKAAEGKTIDEIEKDYEVIEKPFPTENLLICSEKTVEKGEDTWENFSVAKDIKDEELKSLMVRAANNHYQAFGKEADDEAIYVMCASLFRADYICKVLSNFGGALCWNYPQNIVIPIAVRKKDPNSSDESGYYEDTRVETFLENFEDYQKKAKIAALARCRSRFPVPVILFNGKYICRSGTLAVRKGAAFEAARKAAEPESQIMNDQYAVIKFIAARGNQYWKKFYDAIGILLSGVEEMKDQDAEILNYLVIDNICDLMVENRKIHTGMSVSSSEKINKSKYGAFSCIRMPYPGCEFFRKYSEIRSSPKYEEEQKNLIFDWDAPEVDSYLEKSKTEKLPFPELNWDDYAQWDLVTLTKNYMRMLLFNLKTGDKGMLVHCISGWDRTPLFISLLRISLWADALAHDGLDVNQMAFLTLGYDWYLFGHDLPNRIKKREEIMHFCFKFLPEIAGDEYSLLQAEKLNGESRMKRLNKLLSLSQLVLRLYSETIFLQSA